MSEQRHAFACDGAVVPPGWSGGGWVLHTIATRGPGAELNLHIANLEETVLAHVSYRGADLVRIAAYVYAADQMTSRGGEKDVHRSSWRRRMHLSVPVTDPDFWSCEDVRSRLKQALAYLTDDAWEFHFAQAPLDERQIPLPAGTRELHGQPDAVILFSGGADSLCSAIDSVTAGRRPLLVSHQPNHLLDSRQQELRRELRAHFGDWAFPHVSFEIHRVGKKDPSGYTQRSRGFLYAAIGASVASELGVQDVILADNGIVSLNLPITQQVVGALASRGTHPKSLSLVNDFLSLVFPSGPVVSNPLQPRTRAEVLGTLTATGTEHMLALTHSCARYRGRTQERPYCGVCSQCVDRRFGVIAAGLEAFDPPCRYGTDIFIEPLDTNEGGVIAQSFVRFAWELNDLADQELIETYPQLYDVLAGSGDFSSRVAETLISLLRRHSIAVGDALTTMVERHSHLLGHGRLPANCLLNLVKGAQRPSTSSVFDEAVSENLFRSEGGAWRLQFQDTVVTVDDSNGMAYIQRLVLHPQRSFHCLDLQRHIRRTDPPADDSWLLRHALPSVVSEFTMTIDGALQDVVDAEAVAAYRERLAYLKQRQQSGDLDSLEECMTELAELAKELRRTTLRGRRSSFSTPQEKARQSVTQAIGRAIKKIQEYHSALAHHLDASLTTGHRCEYLPPSPVTWKS